MIGCLLLTLLIPLVAIPCLPWRPHPKDQALLEQCAYARLLIGWLTFEGPLPISEKTPRQRRWAKDKLKQQRCQLEGEE